METKYKPSKASKENENIIKIPLIEEHNIMGAKFRNGKITGAEWATFQKEWRERLQNSMHNVVKNRIYVEDSNDQ